jgi:hypothetical protein
MTEPLTDELRSLYADASKHSQYQSLPAFVSEVIGYQEVIDQGWRGDASRLDYIRSRRLPASGEHWADFGANTGYFTLSLAKEHPETHFTAIEANDNHARFIRRIAEAFKMTNVTVQSAALGLNDLGSVPSVDVLLHLNVIHHAGHDFDQAHVPTIAAFDAYAVRYLRALRARAQEMVFQMGSNWGGDKALPLVPVSADTEKLNLMAGYLVNAGWELESIAYPRKDPGGVVYHSVDATIPTLLQAPQRDKSSLASQLGDLNLDTFPGEFYRRPLFQCRRSA